MKLTEHEHLFLAYLAHMVQQTTEAMGRALRWSHEEALQTSERLARVALSGFYHVAVGLAPDMAKEKTPGQLDQGRIVMAI